MSIALNEYATKAYSEHPVALWSLDDDAHFISLIPSNSYRSFSTWTGGVYQGEEFKENWSYDDGPDLSFVDPSPFPEEFHSSIFIDSANENDTIIAISDKLFEFGKLNQQMNSFCVNAFIYQNSISVKSYRLGFRYSKEDSTVVDVFPSNTSVIATEEKGWINFNFSYPLPEDYLDSYGVKLILEIVLSAADESVTEEYEFILNGLSVGQWSEISCYKTLGSVPQQINGIEIDNEILGIQADQYGLLSEKAYYVVENGKLLCDNNALSMVYGSENSANVWPSSNGTPSFIFPGKDMLFENGRYKKFTLEMWLMINPSTQESRKIIGPIDNDYGVYVRDNMLTLVIGSNIASHSIYEWYRPILLQILIEESSASMMVNGELVASLNIDRESIELAQDNNWWGIYSYSDIDIFKIDSISIYPYIMPQQVAKKRFVWGQGVETLQFIDSEFKGTTAAIDFSNANYDVNQIYPDIARWDSAYFDNLDVSQSAINMPNYRLPEINLGGRNLQDWYDANKISTLIYSEPFVTFRPNFEYKYNYMFKPSVEITRWTNTGSSSGEISTEYSFVGQKSLKITLGGADTNISAPRSGTDFQISETGTYWISAYFYIEDVSSPLLSKTVSLGAESGWSGITVLESNPAELINDTWSRASIKVNVTSLEGLGFFVARISQLVSGAILYTDAWMIEKEAELGDYFDGDSAQSEWFGSPHSSISRKPFLEINGSDWTEQCYFKIDWATQFNSPINSFYGIFEISSDQEEERPLIHLVNSLTNDRLEINISGTVVDYSLEGDQFYSEVIEVGQKFVAGINIESLSQKLGSGILSFFNTPALIKMYVGGNAKGGENAKTFEGKIYKIAVMNENNYNELTSSGVANDLDNEWAYTTFFETVVDGGQPNSIFESTLDSGDADGQPSTFFNDFGVTEKEYIEEFSNLYCMYGVVALYRYNRLFLDIEISASWEEYFPLTQFATYVKRADDTIMYDLDSLQINFGYDSKKDYTFVGTEEVEWTYQELKEEYSSPVVKTYEILDNEIITNYENYSSLQRNAQLESVFNFDSSSVRGYITFQPLDQKYNRPLSSFVNTKRLDSSSIIIADSVNSPSDATISDNTKYEFFDNTVIYPPSNYSFERMNMVVHLLFKHKGILSSPIQIRNLEITSKTSGETVPAAIGTKYGPTIYPYIKNGEIFNYKSFNPISIYKGNTPYLYTTSKSGIKIINKNEGERQYGARVPINDSRSPELQIAATQVWMKYDFLKFAINGTSVFEIDHFNGVIEFVVTKEYSSDRGIIYARDKETKLPYTNAVFYQNGAYVKNPVIKMNEWNCIGISFIDPLVFDSYAGSVNLFAGAIFNNISYYSSNGLGRLSDILARQWLRVLFGDVEENLTVKKTWYDWYYINQNTIRTWKAVYIKSESVKYLLTPENIYKAYTGTNKNVVFDENTFKVSNKEFSIANNAKWLSITQKPA
jgi:hypothetical protein